VYTITIRQITALFAEKPVNYFIINYEDRQAVEYRE